MLQLYRNRFATPASLFDSTVEPWSGLRREIDRVFDSMLTGGRQATFDGDSSWIPQMDIEEREDAILLHVELPGVNPDDVSVTVENGVLTISGEKKFARDGDQQHYDGGFRMYERRFGRFERSLTLPSYINAEQAAAQYKDGVLTLELPRSAESRRKKIEIAAADSQKRIESSQLYKSD
jgi:HSP20 family protein